MKLLYSLLFLFATTYSDSQPLQKINQALKGRSIALLDRSITALGKTNFEISRELQRPIVGDYKADIIDIKEFPLANDTSGSHYINNYAIYLLSENDKIFYCKFSGSLYNNDSTGEPQARDTIIENYTDSLRYASFENEYKEIYYDTINKSDIFLNSFVYGYHCGIAGINPDEANNFDMLLASNNVDEIRHWLKSPNAEKQLYAFRGYKVLVYDGYVLTKEEGKILAYLKHKTGNVSICSGCMYTSGDFHHMILEIENTPVKYLRPDIKYSPPVLFPVKSLNNEKDISVYWILGILTGLIFAAFLYYRQTINHNAKKQGSP